MKNKFLKACCEMVRPSVIIDGEQFYVKILTVAEANDLFKSIEDDTDKLADIKNIAKVLVDKDGKSVFDANNQHDIEALKVIPFWLMQKITQDFQEANFGGLTKK